MVRKERQMDEEAAKKFLLESKVGRLGLSQDGEPYVVPIMYFYDPQNGIIFVHCAKKGRKLAAVMSDDRVCFEVDEMKEIVVASTPCEYDLYYRSVIVFGKASLIESPEKKAEVLNDVMRKYAGEKNKMLVTPKMAEGTQVIKIEVSCMTGKEGKGATMPYP